MIFEVAVISASSFVNFVDLQPLLSFQVSGRELGRQNILKGKFLQSSAQFCHAHDPNCQECLRTIDSGTPCKICSFKYKSISALENTLLVMKMSSKGESLDREIWFEGQIQQRLREQFPENIAVCVGNYEKFYYFIRKSTSFSWRAVKISVFIEQNDERLRSASMDSIASSQHVFSQQQDKKFVIEFNELTSRIGDSIMEMALLINRPTSSSSIQLRVDWLDRDFLRKHNYFIVPGKEDGTYQYVFFDFGHNVENSAS